VSVIDNLHVVADVSEAFDPPRLTLHGVGAGLALVFNDEWPAARYEVPAIRPSGVADLDRVHSVLALCVPPNPVLVGTFEAGKAADVDPHTKI
jgi:hypothetical protein